ncbi:MAG: hypothetical protein ACXWE0_11625, partial [Nitrososphaeraceae archaeon]
EVSYGLESIVNILKVEPAVVAVAVIPFQLRIIIKRTGIKRRTNNNFHVYDNIVYDLILLLVRYLSF